MNKQAKKRIEKQINELLMDLDFMFSLQNFSRDVVYLSNDVQEGDSFTMAHVDFDEEYQTISIKIYPIFFEKTPREQRSCLLHELVHSITLPSKQISLDLLNGKLVTESQITFENERLTARIENILDLFLRGGFKYAKKSYIDYEKTIETKNKRTPKKAVAGVQKNKKQNKS